VVAGLLHAGKLFFRPGAHQPVTWQTGNHASRALKSLSSQSSRLGTAGLRRGIAVRTQPLFAPIGPPPGQSGPSRPEVAPIFPLTTWQDYVAPQHPLYRGSIGP
jgi:hypothetical protein